MSDRDFRDDENEEQAAVDTEFAWVMECERALDDVIANLDACGLKVQPWQRLHVVRWLDMFGPESPVPLQHRLAMLGGMLRAKGR